MSRYLLPLALSAVSASVLPQAPEAAVAARAVPGNLLSFPIVERRTYSGNSLRRRAPSGAPLKRDDSATLYNHTNVAYMIELGIGTPAQKVRVQIDTGSDELWVDPDCSTVTTEASQQFCESLGQYDPSSSSTFVDGEIYNTLAYGKGQAEIDYVLDNIVVEGTDNTVLQQVQFGVAIASDNAAVPIMGIGFGNGYNLDYNNILDEMTLQNLTNTRAFSLALGSASSDSGKEDVGDNIGNGVIVFGGVDTKKFTGPLHRFDNLPPQASDEGSPYRYWIQLDSVGFTKAGKSASSAYSDSSLPIVLDSGSSLSYLPDAVMASLADSFDAKAGSDGSIIVDCDAGSKGGSVDFTFGALTISVPLSDFIWEAEAGVCAVGALPASSTTALLGDTFLRSAYVLFDQDHQDIYLATAANCGTNEQVLSGDGSYNVTGECTAAEAAGGDDDSSSAARGLVPTVSAVALAALVGFMTLL